MTKLFNKVLHLFLLSAFLIIAFIFTGCGTDSDSTYDPNKGQQNMGSNYFKDNGDGTIGFSFNNTSTKRLKVVIQKENGANMYQYDVPKGQCDLTFPLTQGNGKYMVYLCKNTGDNKYSIEESMSFELNIQDADSVFLLSSVIVNWDTTNEAIKEAQKLIIGKNSDDEKLKAIYEYMVSNYSYDFDKMNNAAELSKDKMYVPNIEDTYATKMGICYDISTLMASMLRSVSIPAKVVTGYTNNTVSYHAWNNVYYTPKTEWKIIDVTYDVQMKQAEKKYYMFKNPIDYGDPIYMY